MRALSGFCLFDHGLSDCVRVVVTQKHVEVALDLGRRDVLGLSLRGRRSTRSAGDGSCARRSRGEGSEQKESMTSFV